MASEGGIEPLEAKSISPTTQGRSTMQESSTVADLEVEISKRMVEVAMALRDLYRYDTRRPILPGWNPHDV